MADLIKWILITVLAALTAGCSYLENYFPDKEKDYQYTSEIPLLNWPAEIHKNQPVDNSSDINAFGSTTAPSDSNSISGNEPTTSTQANPSTEGAAPAVSPTEVVTSESDDRTTITSVDIVKYDDGESRLRLGTGFAKAWRAVSKALSHNSIEVTERNHDQGIITLLYDPNEKKRTDDSFWDELNFFFHGIEANEEEYRLKLEEHNEQTDLLVLNSEHLPMLNNDNAVRLLKVIADTIKADLAAKDKKAEESEQTQPPQEIEKPQQ